MITIHRERYNNSDDLANNTKFLLDSLSKDSERVTLHEYYNTTVDFYKTKELDMFLVENIDNQNGTSTISVYKLGA